MTDVTQRHQGALGSSGDIRLDNDFRPDQVVLFARVGHAVVHAIDGEIRLQGERVGGEA